MRAGFTQTWRAAESRPDVTSHEKVHHQSKAVQVKRNEALSFP